MPAYDCGDPICDECNRAFGPDRAAAIARYLEREAFYSLPYEERRSIQDAREARADFEHQRRKEYRLTETHK